MYLIEVDAHALELEVGGTIVTSRGQPMIRKTIETGVSYNDTYRPDPSRPCSPEICCLW
jgi:hypothetical protein